MTFIDLFCGIGGFRLGMQRAGFDCVFSAEIHPHACSMYEANFGENPYCDITLLDSCSIANIPDFDILCAGFPCQAFSKAGKAKGFEDTRGTLFFNMCEIISLKKPKILFLENVKNLLAHDGGNTFLIIKDHLENLGYNISYKVLNAKNFNVPQSRERTIIIGVHKDFSDIRFKFDWLDMQSPYFNPVCKDYVSSLPYCINDILENRANFTYLNNEQYTLITDPKRQIASGLIFVGYLNKKMRTNGVLPGREHLSRCHKQNNRIYSSKGTHPTLSSQETSGRYYILVENKVRKLTQLECYRLMGFPDNFIKVGSISQLYNRMGNSVCVTMINAISSILKEVYFSK